MKTTTIDLAHLIANFIQNGGEIKSVDFGNAVRDNDGEDWKTINENSYKIRQDKQQGESA